MAEIEHQQIIAQSSMGFAYHRMLFDETNTPVDYVFMDVNPAFEQLTGLSRSNVLGKRVTQVLPGIEDGEFDWIRFYGDIVVRGEQKEFEQYSKPLGRWYRVDVRACKDAHFITLFRDITKEKQEAEDWKKVSDMSKMLLRSAVDAPDYERIAKMVCDIAGANAAALYLYDKEAKGYRTMAVFTEVKNRWESRTLFDISQKGHLVEQGAKKRDGCIMRFCDVHTWLGEAPSSSMGNDLVDTLDLGEVVWIGIE